MEILKWSNIVSDFNSLSMSVIGIILKYASNGLTRKGDEKINCIGDFQFFIGRQSEDIWVILL